ncbi:hypothetical protein UR09_00905 [Candidatus Nitromaritima sp. SCGC AAA799-A02]|nr:hypothetical protein UZ36_06955 [Candidatus Nitromaritima sp. SCGC AAA799-C22]KMP12614.1 hypothetical protein UR09_00905 [Candidatus Nitromaritima sp. SCGC AAA799-A02]
MFYEVRILDDKGKLKKVLTSEMLTKRHWKLFPDYLKPHPKKKNAFNSYGKAKSTYEPNFDRLGFEDY